MSNCKHFPDADDHCLVCEEADRKAAELAADTFPTETDDEERAEKPAAPFWTVAVYLVDQAYGGPEEGGWWYQTGERIDHALDGVPHAMLTFVCPDNTDHTGEEGARRFAEIVQQKLDATVNFGRREISSVLSTGRYQAQVYNGHPPAHYPATRPHYE